MKKLLVFFLAFAIFLPLWAAENPSETKTDSEKSGETVPPPEGLKVVDAPNDGGKSLLVKIEKSPADELETKKIEKYIIYRKEKDEKDFKQINIHNSWAETYKYELKKAEGKEKELDKSLKEGKLIYTDGRVSSDSSYLYKVQASVNGKLSEGIVSESPVSPYPQWFNTDRVPVLIAVILFFVLIFYFLYQAKYSPEEIYIRRIPGIDAIEEAIGRATEMGRPVLYIPGIGGISNIQTLASLLILEEVSEKVARYSSRILVPNRRPFVMTVAQEVVKQGFINAGKSDAYKEKDVMFLTSNQFAYAAGVNGIMLREKPAANLMLGRFFAESLLLAETGYASGAIQVAGTAEVTQLPFFIAACDYTLIGEELFAASAYLSREPKILSTLKATDWFKIVFLVLIVIGVVLATLGYDNLIYYVGIG